MEIALFFFLIAKPEIVSSLIDYYWEFNQSMNKSITKEPKVAIICIIWRLNAEEVLHTLALFAFAYFFFIKLILLYMTYNII